MSSTLEICHRPHVTVSMQVDESRPPRAGSKWVSFRFTFHRRNDPIITVSDLSRHEATYNKGVLVPYNPPKTIILMEQAIMLGNFARLSTMDIQNTWTTQAKTWVRLGSWVTLLNQHGRELKTSHQVSPVDIHWSWVAFPPTDAPETGSLGLSGQVTAHAGNLVVPYTS